MGGLTGFHNVAKSSSIDAMFGSNKAADAFAGIYVACKCRFVTPETIFSCDEQRWLIITFDPSG